MSAPPNLTPEDIAARKKIHNAEKRRRKRQAEVGAEGVLEDARALEDAKVRKRQKLLSDAQTFALPLECTLAWVKENRRDWYEYIAGDEQVVPQKSQEIGLIRAIWFNQLDQKHTFNPDLPTARANIRLVNAALVMPRKNEVYTDLKMDAEIKPRLLIPYVLACREHAHEPENFVYRDTFIRIWKKSDDDIYMFSRTGKEKSQTLKNFEEDMLSALDSSGFVSAALDLTKGMQSMGLDTELMDGGKTLERRQELHGEWAEEVMEEMFAQAKAFRDAGDDDGFDEYARRIDMGIMERELKEKALVDGWVEEYKNIDYFSGQPDP